jgi:hypothetical protein
MCNGCVFSGVTGIISETVSGGTTMTDWYMILGWGSPIGTGAFLVLLGGMIFLLSKASAQNRKNKRDGD